MAILVLWVWNVQLSLKNTKGTDWSMSFSTTLTLYLAYSTTETLHSSIHHWLPVHQHLRNQCSYCTMENVAIFDSPGKGRGLKATKEFWAGDVIFSEPSVAAVVFDRYSNDTNCGCGRSMVGDVFRYGHHGDIWAVEQRVLYSYCMFILCYVDFTHITCTELRPQCRQLILRRVFLHTVTVTK